MKLTKLIPFLFLALAFTFTMCDDEETPPEVGPYVGLWETEAFGFGGVDAKMDFDIKETSFETEVLTLLGDLEIPALGVKGDITPKTGNELNFSLTDLGLPSASGGFDWKNRVDDAAEFDGIYNGYVSAFMPKDFDAEYELDGDRMDLIIPVAQDTIVMFKK